MPRIDPIELLKCLSVLLSPHGGIKSGDEVRRLASLMTKFSKKLVSKCIYIQILKCTEPDLLGLFMGSGGWKLVHVWLTESIVSNNWPLVKELLELLLLCPVDIERLKTNNCPKLVKELSKDGNHLVIRALASKLVEQWLRTVKGENVIPLPLSELDSILKEIKIEFCKSAKDSDDIDEKNNQIKRERDNIEGENEEKERDSEVLPVLKITVKDGKQFISQLDDSKNKNSEKSSRERSSDKSRSSKSRSHSSSSDKHRHSSQRSSSSSSNKNKEKSSDKDKSSSRSGSRSDKDNERKSSDKHKSSSHKSSKHDKKESSKSRDKQKEHEKSDNKVTSDVNSSPTIQKLGKIPKLSDKKDKLSISIEVRKPEDPKPKTVKTFHSKFRKHGLEEEVKPPPSRASLLSKKAPPPLPPTVAIPKRPSPIHNDTPPEKKAKTIDAIEKPGAIKLIPPKPKPMMLLESDMFMDALNASATNKKEPKKRKRRTSGSKDGTGANDGSPPHSLNSSLTSPNRESKSVPPRFYQDTLETDDDKEKSSEREDNRDNSEPRSPDKSPEDELEKLEINIPHTLTVNGLKGVLCYHKKKGPKKSIRWKPDIELEEIQYFELDETERVNVTKTFTDMKQLERVHERESFQKARNLSTDDIMEERTAWRPLILIDTEGQIVVDYGKNSKEKDIQALKQKGTLQPLYLYKTMIPDSPFEPPVETHTYNEPTVIPLEDVTGNQDNVSDFRNMPWPEPKGTAPPQSSANMNMQQMFQPPMGQFPNAFPNPFPGVSGFQGAGMVPGDWSSGVPPIMANGMPHGAVMPGAMPPGVMPPGILPPENMMMTPEMFGAPNPMFQGMHPNMMDGMNMPPAMFPPEFNMGGAAGPPGGDGFGGFRGGMRGRGVSGPNWRGKAPGNWDNSSRGRGGGPPRGGRKTVCIYFQRKGSCRQGENCSFLHPGVHTPF